MATITTIDECESANHQSNKDVLNTIDNEILAIRASIPGILVGSATYDAGSIADGDEEIKSITVTGAALGDFVLASLSVDAADLTVTGFVKSADTVYVSLANNTGGAIDLASCTARVLVISKSAVALAAKVLAKT